MSSSRKKQSGSGSVRLSGKEALPLLQRGAVAGPSRPHTTGSSARAVVRLSELRRKAKLSSSQYGPPIVEVVDSRGDGLISSRNAAAASAATPLGDDEVEMTPEQQREEDAAALADSQRDDELDDALKGLEQSNRGGWDQQIDALARSRGGEPSPPIDGKGDASEEEEEMDPAELLRAQRILDRRSAAVKKAKEEVERERQVQELQRKLLANGHQYAMLQEEKERKDAQRAAEDADYAKRWGDVAGMKKKIASLQEEIAAAEKAKQTVAGDEPGSSSSSEDDYTPNAAGSSSHPSSRSSRGSAPTPAEVAAALAAASPPPAKPVQYKYSRQLNVPKRLTYTDASNSSVLDQWCIDVELYFEQTAVNQSNVVAVHRELRPIWDSDIDRWFTERNAELTLEGKGVHGWNGVKLELRKNFIPASEATNSFNALMALSHLPSETADQFLLKVDKLRLRAKNAFSSFAVDDAIIARLVATRLDKSRYPITSAAVNAAMFIAPIDKPISFPSLRSMIQVAALSEPKFNTQPANPQQRPQQKPRNNQASAKPTVANTEILEEQMEAMEVSAMTEEQRKDAKCHKCGVKGHISKGCKSATELRKCYKCKEYGHLSNTCPKPKA